MTELEDTLDGFSAALRRLQRAKEEVVQAEMEVRGWILAAQLPEFADWFVDE